MRHWYLRPENKIIEVRIISKLNSRRLIIRTLKGDFEQEVYSSSVLSSKEIVHWINSNNSDLEHYEFKEVHIRCSYCVVTSVWRQYKSDLGNLK